MAAHLAPAATRNLCWLRRETDLQLSAAHLALTATRYLMTMCWLRRETVLQLIAALPAAASLLPHR